MYILSFFHDATQDGTYPQNSQMVSNPDNDEVKDNWLSMDQEPLQIIIHQTFAGVRLPVPIDSAHNYGLKM